MLYNIGKMCFRYAKSSKLKILYSVNIYYYNYIYIVLYNGAYFK
uniref:Uncharacterized protein n=1 Tax=viral metagenome TaxID=1070528 RepID=A0A6C0EVK4_9ZZZZ